EPTRRDTRIPPETSNPPRWIQGRLLPRIAGESSAVGKPVANPRLATLHPWLLDVWAQTSAPDQACPEVGPWLRGQQDETPETSVAWRAEVEWLSKVGVHEEDRRRAFDVYRVLPHERLQEPTWRMKDKLKELEPETRVLVVSPNGDVESRAVGELAKDE